jgi:colicin import membrane protein
MNKFENWYTSILEEVATPTKTLVGDVDTIISSLDTLVKELTEELDSPEFNEVNEAVPEGPSKVWQWMWWMPKARKAQQKVNKIKLNVTDMEAAAEDAPDTDQRSKINAKAQIAKEQASELQTLVDDKYGEKGELVKRALHNEKIAGQIASIKRATGLEDDPNKKASYKEKMAELQQKYKEDQAAIKELEPSEEDKAAEKERKQKELDDAKAKQDKLNADAEAAKNKKKEPASTDAPEDNDTPETTDAPEDTKPKSEPKPGDKNSKEGKLKRLEDMLAKAKESGDEKKSKKYKT